MSLTKISNRINLQSTSLLLLGALISAPHTLAQSKKDPTPFQAAMQGMSQNFKALGPNIAIPEEKSNNLALLRDLKQNTLASATQIPPRADKLIGQAKDDFIALYVSRLNELVKIIEEIEAALQNNQFTEAQVLLQKVAASRREGHSEFKE